MNEVNKTLYIPLYGKALVSKNGLILHDPKAEHIWKKEGFSLKAKSKSKWLAYYMGMRAAVFDAWTARMVKTHPEAVVLHIGCGMDSRCERVGGPEADTGKTAEKSVDKTTEKKSPEKKTTVWYDVDFPEVIAERRRYYTESENYHMVEADARETDWIRKFPGGGTAIVVMEGISMYMDLLRLVDLLTALHEQFDKVHLLMDCYTELGAKASKVKNPVQDVGVSQVWGLDHPEYLAEQSGLLFVAEHEMTPTEMIDQLPVRERKFFKAMFGGKIAKKLYRLYEYEGA